MYIFANNNLRPFLKRLYTMGRRKGSKNKKRKGATKTSSTQNTFMTEFLGGLTVVLGLALIVIFKFDNMGVLSQWINNVFTGLLGEMRMILPIICFYVGGATIISSKKIKILPELLKGFVVVMLISASVFAFDFARYDLWTNPGEFVDATYNGALKGENIAGILGGIIANITYLAGDILSKIILITFTLFFTLYFINLGLRDFFAIIYNIIIAIVEFFANIFITVFSTDEEKIKKRELKIKEREKAKREKEIEKIHKIDEQRAKAVERKYENIKDDDGQLPDLKYRVKYYDRYDNLITEDDGYITYDVLKAGRSKSFSFYTSYVGNAQRAKISVEFDDELILKYLADKTYTGKEYEEYLAQQETSTTEGADSTKTVL